LRRCPAPDVVRCDVLVVVCGRPAPTLWRHVAEAVEGWLSLPAASADVAVAVAQFGGAGEALELLTAPHDGGFVRRGDSEALEALRLLRPAHFRAPSLPVLRPRWRAAAEALVALHAADAALGAVPPPLAAAAAAGVGAAGGALLRRRKGISQRVLVVARGVTGQLPIAAAGGQIVNASSAAPPPGAAADWHGLLQVAELQSALEVDTEGAKAVVAVVRARAHHLRRSILRAQRAAAAAAAAAAASGGADALTNGAASVAAPASAREEALRLAIVLDGVGAPLCRAVYGEPWLEDSYRGGREGARGVSYFRMRDSCRNAWHPLCPSGGALQVNMPPARCPPHSLAASPLSPVATDQSSPSLNHEPARHVIRSASDAMVASGAT
jgi:hypothetical protein